MANGQILGMIANPPMVDFGEIRDRKHQRFTRQQQVLGAQQAQEDRARAGESRAALGAALNASLPPQVAAQFEDMLQVDPQGALAALEDLGVIGNRAISSEGRTFNQLTSGLSEEDVELARRIKLGLDPRAVGSASQTIAEAGTGAEIGASEGLIAGGRESGKIKAQIKWKPELTKRVKLAEKAATERGEVLTDLKRSEAALPGLLESIGELKELSAIATSTLGGRAFDAIVRESGFGATKGADARAKFVAIVSNQVLPLLKPTFGAAFTVAEGDSLRATMGDPDLSPSEKIAQLEAFIEQKVRDIQTKERQLGQEVTPSSELIPQISDEDLLRKYGG